MCQNLGPELIHCTVLLPETQRKNHTFGSDIPWPAIKRSGNIHSCDADACLSHPFVSAHRLCNPETLHTPRVAAHTNPPVPIGLKVCPWRGASSECRFITVKFQVQWTTFPRAHFVRRSTFSINHGRYFHPLFQFLGTFLNAGKHATKLTSGLKKGERETSLPESYLLETYSHL